MFYFPVENEYMAGDFLYTFCILMAATLFILVLLKDFFSDAHDKGIVIREIHRMPKIILILGCVGILYLTPHGWGFFISLHLILSEIGRSGQVLISLAFHTLALSALFYSMTSKKIAQKAV